MKTNNKKGFSLIEAIIAIFVVVVGLIAVYGVTHRIIANTRASLFRLQATYLVQEGLEIVRNMRDTNYLFDHDWNKGFLLEDTGCAELKYQIDYNDLSFSCYDEDSYLNFEDEYNRFGYSPGTPTVFKRSILITNIEIDSIDAIEIEVIVEWREKGEDYDLSMKEILYNWN